MLITLTIRTLCISYARTHSNPALNLCIRWQWRWTRGRGGHSMRFCNESLHPLVEFHTRTVHPRDRIKLLPVATFDRPDTYARLKGHPMKNKYFTVVKVEWAVSNETLCFVRSFQKQCFPFSLSIDYIACMNDKTFGDVLKHEILHPSFEMMHWRYLFTMYVYLTGIVLMNETATISVYRGMHTWIQFNDDSMQSRFEKKINYFCHIY